MRLHIGDISQRPGAAALSPAPEYESQLESKIAIFPKMSDYPFVCKNSQSTDMGAPKHVTFYFHFVLTDMTVRISKL